MADERLSCGHCGSGDIEVNERPDAQQPSGAWPYVDRAVLSCRRCHHHWTRVETAGSQMAAG